MPKNSLWAVWLSILAVFITGVYLSIYSGNIAGKSKITPEICPAAAQIEYQTYKIWKDSREGAWIHTGEG